MYGDIGRAHAGWVSVLSFLYKLPGRTETTALNATDAYVRFRGKQIDRGTIATDVNDTKTERGGD